MENTKFCAMTEGELQTIDGGFVLTLATVLFTVGKIGVTVGMVLKGGAAVGLVAGGAVVLSK